MHPKSKTLPCSLENKPNLLAQASSASRHLLSTHIGLPLGPAIAHKAHPVRKCWLAQVTDSSGDIGLSTEKILKRRWGARIA